ncbi:MAG: hypothetical protein A2017_11580 [Lentisphaerae bacterium GWF2_44_16]|nr:MAG: hypothetical protein A2017_11580 [Lentisphaerae bacterium GWF2_44_16]
MLDMTGRGKGICALASYSGNKVSGLILGRFENKEAEMLSVYVNPFFRKKGIASMLLKQFEKKAAAAGCSKIKAAFTSAMPSFGAVKRLFEKNGWSKPQKRMKLIYFSRENLYREIQENPRYEKYKNALLPKGFELVKWCELQPEKIAQIKSRHNQPGGWTDDNTPFREPEKMEKLNSFAILKDDSVAGWFITHRINPDTIRYTQIYNDPVANGMRGIIIQTVIHAYWLHAMYGPEKGCFIIYEWNTSLLKIFEKLMEKLTDSCTESFGVEKDIGQD